MSGLLRSGLHHTLLCTVAPLALTVLSWAQHAEARRGGIVVDSCHGCHGDGSASPELTLSADPPTFEPGEQVTFTLTVQRSSMSVAGTFITTGGVGSFETLAGEGLGVSAQGLTHTSPKSALNGEVTFRFVWQVPTDPGGVDFRVLALAANGNNAVTGDAPGCDPADCELTQSPDASGAASPHSPGSPAGTEALPGMSAAATPGTTSERSSSAGSERSGCAILGVAPGCHGRARATWSGTLALWLTLVVLLFVVIRRRSGESRNNCGGRRTIEAV